MPSIRPTVRTTWTSFLNCQFLVKSYWWQYNIPTVPLSNRHWGFMGVLMWRSQALRYRTAPNATSNLMTALEFQYLICLSRLPVTAQIQTEFTCRTPNMCSSTLPISRVVGNFVIAFLKKSKIISTLLIKTRYTWKNLKAWKIATVRWGNEWRGTQSCHITSYLVHVIASTQIPILRTSFGNGMLILPDQ